MAEEGADLARIENEIKTMPNYFADYDTTVHFISQEELDRDHSGIPHGGFVIRTGTTGADTKQMIEYSLKLGSNPEFTANALVYLLMNIGVGLLPYILLFFRIDRGHIDGHSIPWVNCLIISAVTFLGLVIFKGRDLRSEIAKRLHL